MPPKICVGVSIARHNSDANYDGKTTPLRGSDSAVPQALRRIRRSSERRLLKHPTLVGAQALRQTRSRLYLWRVKA